MRQIPGKLLFGGYTAYQQQTKTILELTAEYLASTLRLGTL